MSYPINYPTPQGANVQMFSEGGTTSNWTKPQGCSFVYFTLIGAGGGGGTPSGNPASGGGSGAVTTYLVPSFLIPDILQVNVGAGGAANSAGTATTVSYQQKAATAYTLLTANGGGGGTTAASPTGGSAGSGSSAIFFGVIGFYQSTGGQIGTTTATNVTAFSNSFLSGGAGGCSSASTGSLGGSVTANYGYVSLNGGAAAGADGGSGQGFISPALVSVGGSGGSGNSSGVGGRGGNGGFGSGGGGGGRGSSGGGSGGKGGDGLVVIISW